MSLQALEPDKTPRIVAYHLKTIREAGVPEPVAYDVFIAFDIRGTMGSATNVFKDYVYYDGADRCVWLSRKKID